MSAERLHDVHDSAYGIKARYTNADACLRRLRDIARGDIANYFATKGITRFTNDPIGIGREGEREGHCYQWLPRETTMRGPGPNGASGEAALHE